MRSTVPTSVTIPVNITDLPRWRPLPLLHPCASQEVVPDPLPFDGERSLRILHPLRAGSGDQRAPAAENARCGEEPQLVDLAGVEECARQHRTSLEQNARDLAPAELRQRRADALRARAADDDHLDAGVTEGLDSIARGAGRGDRVRAGRLPAVMRARLERDVERRPSGIPATTAAVLERRDLGVPAAE